MRWYHFGLVAIVILAGSAPHAAVFAEDAPPFKIDPEDRAVDIRTGEPEVSADQLAKNLTTTRMPGVQNHFDHLTPDLKNNRIFVVPKITSPWKCTIFAQANLFMHQGNRRRTFGVVPPDVDRIFRNRWHEGALQILTERPMRILRP